MPAPQWDYAKLRAWREHTGLRREQVCVDLDISFSWLVQLETGGTTRQPGFGLLVRLAAYYGHDVTELIVAQVAS